MANLQRMDSDTSAYSFTSEQLEMGEDDELGCDIEYEVAPWDIFGVHDIDGQILAVKKGEALPKTSKYKKKHSASDPATYRVKSVVQSPQLGDLAMRKSKGEGGYRGLAKRIGENYYNRIVRPTIKRPAEACVGEEGTAKKKMKKIKGYCLTAEKWNVDAGASKDEKEEALKQYRKMGETLSFLEKVDMVMDAKLFIQRQFRELEPSQSVEDLNTFWDGGPPIMSRWFEWLVSGSKLGCLANAAAEQMTKICNIVEEFIISKRGEDFEREMKRVENESKEMNGNITMYQVFLLKDLAKLFKNKPEKVIVVDGRDAKQIGPEEQDPNIFITKQNTFGETEFEEKIIIHLRIGDKVVWRDISLPEALGGIIQVYFSSTLQMLMTFCSLLKELFATLDQMMEPGIRRTQ